MKTTKYINFLGWGVINVILYACTFVQPTDYTGIDYVYLDPVNSSEIQIGLKDELEVKVTAVMKADKDIVLHPVIKSLNGGEQNGVRIKENEVVLKAGNRYSSFTVIADKHIGKKSKSYFYEISLDKLNENMQLFAPLKIEVVDKGVMELTDAQKELIEIYKKKGMDINPFLGSINVHTMVNIPADGLIKGLETPQKLHYDGQCYITLSEKSNENNIVLKMVDNSMGLKDFFYYGLKKNTIENDEFWFAPNAGPNYRKVTELIHWNKSSLETFSVDLDGITFKPDASGITSINYVKKVTNYNGYGINCVPFVFHYTAWDRLKALVDEGNEEAIECNKTDASSNPDVFLNNTTITKDTFQDYPLPKLPPATGEIDCKKGVMKFHFLTSVEHAGWYITVDVEYKGNVKLE